MKEQTSGLELPSVPGSSTPEAIAVKPSLIGLAAELAKSVFTGVADLEHPNGNGTTFRIVGRGLPEIGAAMPRLERATKRSCWGMLPTIRFYPGDASYSLNDRSRQRGLSMRQITTANAIGSNPLLLALDPDLRVGPVVTRCIFLDGTAAMLEGPPTSTGLETAWLITDRDIVALVRQLWDLTWDASSPCDDHPARQLTRRQASVAAGLIRGMTDEAQARHLGISRRTVFNDVAQVLECLGARTRAEAVFILGGGTAVPCANAQDFLDEPRKLG